MSAPRFYIQYPKKPTKAFAIKKMPAEKPADPPLRVVDKSEKYIEKKPNRPSP